MVTWLKKIFSNAKAYIIAAAAAVFGFMYMLIGMKNRKITKLNNKLEESNAKRRQAEADSKISSHIASESVKIDAQTVEKISNVKENATGQEYNEVVQGFSNGKDSTNSKNNKGRSK